MKDEALKRFLDLVEKTGDKVIITDPAGEHPYVLMGLDQYERLVTGTPAAKHVEAAPAVPAPSMAPKPAPKPLKGLGFQQDTVLWKPQSAAIKAPARPRAVSAPPAIEGILETEGEEQFFLEPLE
jgi:hypothetical protein